MLHVNDLSDLPESLLKENGLHVDAEDVEPRPEKNPVRVAAGIKAKTAGEIAEGEFDDMADRYASEGLALTIPQFPEFVEQGRTTLGRTQYVYGHWEKHGQPDRAIYIQGCAAMLEIKTISGIKSYKTLTKGMHQFDLLSDAYRFGVAAGYIIRWDYEDQVEWRIYPIEDLEMNEGGVTFYRATGLLVELEYPNRLPHWLPLVQRMMKCLNNEKTR